MGNNEFQEKAVYSVKQFYKGLDTDDEEVLAELRSDYFKLKGMLLC